jgi:hypothetical protein
MPCCPILADSRFPMAFASSVVLGTQGTTPARSSSSGRRNTLSFTSPPNTDWSASEAAGSPSSLSLGRVQSGLSSWQQASSSCLQSSGSIPKAANYLKVQGFNACEDSLAVSPAQSLPKSSLLTRQLSSDAMITASPSLHQHLAAMPSPSGPSTSLLAQKLQQVVQLAPTPLASRREVPDDLLKHYQVGPRFARCVLRPEWLVRLLFGQFCCLPQARIPDDLWCLPSREIHCDPEPLPLPALPSPPQARLPVFREPLVVRSFELARHAHDGRYRMDGEPTLLRCAAVAGILAELGANDVTVAAALLHDALDDTLLVEAQLRPMLRQDQVVDLVVAASHIAHVTSLHRASGGDGPARAQALVTMLVASGHHAALLIKVAEKLRDMRALAALPPAQRSELVSRVACRDPPLAQP